MREDLGKSSSAVVIGGIVYIAEWSKEFPPQLTSFQEFHRTPLDSNKVLTMHHPNMKVSYANVEKYDLEIVQLRLKHLGYSWWLGIRKMFDPFQADLSGIGGKPGEVYVNKIVQKTEIRINEAGLQQAALKSVDVEEGKAEI